MRCLFLHQDTSEVMIQIIEIETFKSEIYVCTRKTKNAAKQW